MNTKPVKTNLDRIFDFAVLLLLAFVVFFRTLSAGQDLDSMTTAFIGILLWFAAFLWLIAKLLHRDICLAVPKIIPLVLLFIIAVGISIFTAYQGGDGFHALLMGQNWLLDIVLMLLIFEHCRRHERFVLLMGMLVAALALNIAYSLYQRSYAMQYFQSVLDAKPELIAETVGNNTRQQGMFNARARSLRVYGPYGYPNTLAGLMVLLLPLLFAGGFWGARRQKSGEKRGGFFLLFLAFLGVLVLLLTGSKGGILAARVIEPVAFIGLATGLGYCQRKHWLGITGLFIITSFGQFLLYLGLKYLGSQLVVDVVTEKLYLGIFFAILWGCEIVLLQQFVCAKIWTCRHRLFAVIAVLILLLVSAVSVWLLADAPQGPANLRQAIKTYKRQHLEGRTSLAVRENYWMAAVNMIKEKPLLGVGLDQFGNYYTSYKPVQGWAVKRVHNTYLQILTDGGIVLFLPWLAIWLYCLFLPKPVEELEAEPLTGGVADSLQFRRRLQYCGSGLVLAALFITYMIFGGLHIEFFFNEIYAGPASQWPLNKAPALIHLLVHLVFLPAVALAAFWIFTSLFFKESDRGMSWLALRLGLGALFLHLFVDFFYHMQVISMLSWTVLGLLLARSAANHNFHMLRLRFSKRMSDFAIPLITVVFGLLGWFIFLKQWSVTNYLEAANLKQRSGDSKAALRLYQEVENSRPASSLLYRQLSNIYFTAAFREANSLKSSPFEKLFSRSKNKQAIERVRPWIRLAALYYARLARDFNPALAAAHAYVGRVLCNLFPRERERLLEARECFEEAHKRYAYRPGYLLWLGRIEMDLGNSEKGEELLRKALELNRNPLLTDDRARLSGEQESTLKKWLKVPRN